MDGEKHVADYFIISGISEKELELNAESKPFISTVLPITDIAVIFKGLGEQCPIGYTCLETTPGGHSADLNNGNFKSQNIHICFKRGNDKPPLVDVGVYYEDKDRVLPDVEVVYATPYGRCASTGNIGSSKSGTFITYRRAKTNNPYNQLVVVDLCVILNNKSEHPPHAFYSIKKNLNKSYYGMIGSEVFLCYKKTLLSPPSLSFTPHIISRFPLQDYANFPLPDTVPLFCLPAGANIELRPTNVPLPRPSSSTFVLTSDSAQKIYGFALSFYEPFDRSQLTADQLAKLGLNTFKHTKTAVVEANHDADGSSNESRDEEKNLDQEREEVEEVEEFVTQETFAIKSICILSRWPFFDCFEKYLNFLHRLVFNPHSLSAGNSPTALRTNNVPLEHHISHFLLDVSFPTPQRPTVLAQLMPGTDETVTISQPSSRLPLPLTGASFVSLLARLGVENTMNVLLFGLCEQKILLHSLNNWVLTGVAEAITAMLFPFHWQCPYVPLCPLSLHGILNAPLPFIVGIDSRCFDTFTPPDDVICIDLDTQSIFLSELKKCLNPRILPKRAARVLRNSLEKIFQKWSRITQAIGSNQSPQHRSPAMEASRQQLERKLGLEIQEAFVRFMATILRGFRSYLLPITRAPTIGATDPTSLFNFQGFLMSRDRSYSQFYQLITKTQMFTHYIEERSFVSDKDTSLAFFDDCEEKLTASDDIFSDRPIKLFDFDESHIQTDRSVYIPAPEQSPSCSFDSTSAEQLLEQQQQQIGNNSPQHHNHNSHKNRHQQQQERNNFRKLRFGPLNAALFHRHPQMRSNYPSLDKAFNAPSSFENHLFNKNLASDVNNSFSISRRTKQEVKASQKMAKRSTDTSLDWSKYLVSCCYCLWFSTLPSYIAYCKSVEQAPDAEQQANEENAATASAADNCANEPNSSKSISRILRYAYSTIVRMQKLQLSTDEICFRVLTLLCGHYGQPALAVRIFFEMRKAGIKPNAVTYGYYNKAVLESRWPDHSSKPTTVLWNKIRNVIRGIALFKSHGRLRMENRIRYETQLAAAASTTDPMFNYINTSSLDVVDRGLCSNSCNNDLFRPTTLPINRNLIDDDDLTDRRHTNYRCNNSINNNNKGRYNAQHRGSLVNRSFSTYQKSSTLDINNHDMTFDQQQHQSQQQHKNLIHKSYSMHLRNGSPERGGGGGSLIRMKSSSLEDEDDVPVFYNQKPYPISNQLIESTPAPMRRITSTNDLFVVLKERHQLLTDLDDDTEDSDRSSFIIDNLNKIDNSAGLLFTTNLEICRTRQACRSASHSPALMKSGNVVSGGNEDTQGKRANNCLPNNNSNNINIPTTCGQAGNLLLDSNLPQHTHINDPNAFLKANSFGEDAQILRKLDSRTENQKPNFSSSIDCLGETLAATRLGGGSGDDFVETTTASTIAIVRGGAGSALDDYSSEETHSNRLSESVITDRSEEIAEEEDEEDNEDELSMLKNITSTPNFKLTSLINDASNMQWSKWTSSQNSKNVYKGIKNAATGIVSSLQEIKSSFSISNSATPSKLLTSAKSTTTREMLSQWANIFSSQSNQQGDDDDDSDVSSIMGSTNDLLHLSNDEEVEPSAAAESNDFRFCHKLFVALEKHYNNSSSKEDLIDHSSGDDSIDPNEVAMEIRMTTCSRCNVCHSLLYDEEIMEKWSHNESNLNTKCIYCRARIVPLMNIFVEDYRFKKTSETGASAKKAAVQESSGVDNLLDLDFEGIKEEPPSGEQAATQPSMNGVEKKSATDSQEAKQTANQQQQQPISFTVPYLSPIVLRKELESVFESSGDNCPANSQFVDEHPIIFWNLLWYFSRINVPTHLGLLCLNSKSILNGRQVEKKVAETLNKVVVKTLWDNDKLHSEIGKPLYRLLERGDPSTQVQAILCDELHFTRSFLKQVINLIKNNELHKAMNLILNARLKSSTRFSFDRNRHNLYRDLIFLLNMELGPGKLYMDNFEREYKKAFDSLNFHQVALNRFDRPPTVGSLFCRKCFKEPSLS